MAAHAQIRANVMGLQSSVRLGTIEIPLPQPSFRQSRGFIRSDEGLYVSTKAGLQGARAALMAIGFEAIAVACVIGFWLIKLASR
ncbi:MAG TPA: hypothetical protein VK716_10865 [Terracidiphilus sp.]|jgi:hypothetical protein|nr:hypothetical protein [Terracidiphilus sp.]